MTASSLSICFSGTDTPRRAPLFMSETGFMSAICLHFQRSCLCPDLVAHTGADVTVSSLKGELIPKGFLLPGLKWSRLHPGVQIGHKHIGQRALVKVKLAEEDQNFFCCVLMCKCMTRAAILPPPSLSHGNAKQNAL